MSIKRAAYIAALFIFSSVQSLIAQDVTLTSRDKSVQINGNLLGFDGQFYRVETDYGELTVDGSGVDCAGPGCPNLSAFVAEVDISGAAEIGSLLLPALIEAFAAKNGFKTEREGQSEESLASPSLRNRMRPHWLASFLTLAPVVKVSQTSLQTKPISYVDA